MFCIWYFGINYHKCYTAWLLSQFESFKPAKLENEASQWVLIPVLNFRGRGVPSVQNHSLHLLILPFTPSSFQDLPVFLFPLLYSASSFLLALCSSSVSMLRSFQTLPLFFYGSFSAFVSLHSQTSKRHYLYNYLYCSIQVLLRTEFFICL